MKKKDLNMIIAGIGVITLSCNVPLQVGAKENNINYGLSYEDSSIEKDVYNFLTNEDRFKAIEDLGKELKAERIRKEEEEKRKREEEERLRLLQEEIRKENVKVNLDNVLEVSNITTKELEEVFAYYDYSHNMIPLAYILVEIEERFGINAFIIAGIIGQESNYARSTRAVRDNNLLGWGVYNSSAVGINASSKYENLIGAAEFLRNEYLTPGGLYFNGYSTLAINQNYCFDETGTYVDDNWRISVNAIAKNFEWVYKNIVK